MLNVRCLSILLILIFSISISFVQAQDSDGESEMQTLFGNKNLTFRGMGGLQFGYSKFNGADLLLVGVKGGVLINQKVIVGVCGWGTANTPSFSAIDDNSIVYLEGGYGGLLFEPIIKSNKLVHLSFPVIIGAGDLMYLTKLNRNMSDLSYVIDADPFFIIEPGVDLELNLFRKMRIGAGVSYHWSPDLDLIDTPKNPYNGFTASISIKFGRL